MALQILLNLAIASSGCSYTMTSRLHGLRSGTCSGSFALDCLADSGRMTFI